MAHFLQHNTSLRLVRMFAAPIVLGVLTGGTRAIAWEVGPLNKIEPGEVAATDPKDRST